MHALSLQPHILSLNAAIRALVSSPDFLQPIVATAPTASDAANSVNPKRISAPGRCYSPMTPYQRPTQRTTIHRANDARPSRRTRRRRDRSARGLAVSYTHLRAHETP